VAPGPERLAARAHVSRVFIDSRGEIFRSSDAHPIDLQYAAPQRVGELEKFWLDDACSFDCCLDGAVKHSDSLRKFIFKLRASRCINCQRVSFGKRAEKLAHTNVQVLKGHVELDDLAEQLMWQLSHALS
jgi:hypothetical protein